MAAGRIALDEGQYPQALTWLSRAAMLQPENGLIAYDLSRAYYLNGKLQEAIQWGRKAADRLVNMAEPRSNLGWMLGVSGNVEEAEQMLQDALRLKPDLVIARINLAELRLSWNNPTGALDALTDGFDRQQATADWWYTLGRVYEANNDFSGAVQAYREAVNIRPEFAEVWNNLGLIAQKQGQLDDAVSCFQRAIEADPDFMKPRFNLAQVYCASGQTEEARRIFEHLIQQLGPEHPEVNLVKDALNNCSRQNQTAPETR
ncbi:MAG TPA: tetratricopeptide repeat protein [Candidatus Hydrogenedentes bacterium]|nr:tetratricopeptide repeat protein [Candidatus Hydrogenedentota bacterium]